jgi:hypothetical protein
MISTVDLQVTPKRGTIRIRDGQVTEGVDPALTRLWMNARGAADPRQPPATVSATGSTPRRVSGQTRPPLAPAGWQAMVTLMLNFE